MLSSFYLSETEVTQDDWEKVMGSNLSVTKGVDLPNTSDYMTKLLTISQN